MSFSNDDDLMTPGGEAASQVTGGAFRMLQARLVEGAYGDTAYFLSFLIGDPLPEQAAAMRMKLSQRLRDELIGRGVEHLPIIRLLSQADWEQRQLA